MRYPDTYDPIIAEIARKSGIPVSSWLALAVSQQAGLEIPDYVKDELEEAARKRAIQESEQELEMLEMPQSA
ncbi:hypothetical protein ACPW96_22815 [Micromonospora sp. DT81.3]|uniref:hypothetical protein n=1 Tax=Micromonospora sp. DT81.3 TaxID=3416523 RepID=UPI003CF728E2